MSFCTRLFLTATLLFNTSFVHASLYDDDVLDIFSKILPRIILMSSQKSKIQDDIHVCILHDDVDSDVVLRFIDKIDDNYPQGIKNHPIDIVNSDYTDLNLCQDTQLTFLFNSSAENIDKSIVFLNEHSILTLAYDQKLLRNGVNVSLFLGRKVVPYINMKSFENNGIRLDNILLRVSKIYVEDVH